MAKGSPSPVAESRKRARASPHQTDGDDHQLQQRPAKRLRPVAPPSKWERLESKTFAGKFYWYNAETDERRWTAPPVIAWRIARAGENRSIQEREKFYQDTEMTIQGGGGLVENKGTHKELCRLTRDQTLVYRANPHMHQVFANHRSLQRPDRPLDPGDRVATANLEPRTPYSRRGGEVKTVEHWDVRKRLIMEVEFLTLHGEESRTVVYVGAAPGIHLSKLAQAFFPDHRFILFDPEPLDTEPSEKLEVRAEVFNSENVAEFAGKGVLFICDLEQKSMPEQQQWMRVLQPKAALLTFSLPYPPPTLQTEFLDGDIMMPVWNSATGIETLLMVTEPVRCLFLSRVVSVDQLFRRVIHLQFSSLVPRSFPLSFCCILSHSCCYMASCCL